MTIPLPHILLAPLVFLLAACAVADTATPVVQTSSPLSFDFVIAGGTVVDPETERFGIYNVGVRGGQIAAISEVALDGRDIIDATGLIVAPGFIDIHSHSPTPLGVAYQLRDGVTTQLDLEAGAFPVAAYGFAIRGKSPINFGNSVSHLAVRVKVMEGRNEPYLFNEQGASSATTAMVEPASPAQIAEMRGLLAQGLDNGGLGIGVLLDYISTAVGPEELAMVFALAGERDVPVTVHVRRGMPGDPAGLDEVIALAESSGAPLLVCHITHSAMQAVPDWLAKIDAANARGARIATETLSYAAGGTSIGAAVFGRDWQSVFNITYADVQWTATGEWLTEQSFERYRREQPSGMINHHYVDEQWMEQAIAWPDMMVVSDVTPAFSEDVMANPNLSGTFGRLLGHYVRERGVIELPEAIRRITLLPAQWLEQVSPAFAAKGRIQIGADADLTIFDASEISAKATYGAPYVATEGISHVIVAGESVLRGGKIVAGVHPGQHLLAPRQ